MDNIVGTLQLGWKALLFQEEAYEEMRTSASPVVKGLILIVVVGVVIALLALLGDVVEWAGTPDLGQIQDTVAEQLTLFPLEDEREGKLREVQRYLVARFGANHLRRAVLAQPAAPLPEWRVDWRTGDEP